MSISHRFHNVVFVVLFSLLIGLLAWFSTRHAVQFDWSQGGRNSLSEASRSLLDTLEGPVQITAFAREEPVLRTTIEQLLGRFLRANDQISLRFVDPDREPERIRQLGVTKEGQLLLSYQGREELLERVSEQTISNGLMRLSRSEQREVVFLKGHGERIPGRLDDQQTGKANHDWGRFGRELAQRGFHLRSQNLLEEPFLGPKTSLLVVADPRTELLAGELQRIEAYLDQGGALLWVVEPGRDLPPALKSRFGLTVPAGTVVDATTQLFGIKDPSFSLVTRYDPDHPVTRNLEQVSVYPRAAHVQIVADAEARQEWDTQALLQTLPRSWVETGPLPDASRGETGHIEFNQGKDLLGPLNLGIALTRVLDAPMQGAEQRVVVLGDGDFLANSYLGNGGNLQVGLALFNWLTRDDALIQIPARISTDQTLELRPWQTYLIGFGFLIGLPALLVLSGALIWWRRRNR